MKVYVWRHNRKFHSYSMINEPCVHQDFYTDVVAIVAANSIDEALKILAEQNSGWRVEDLKLLECKEYDLDKAQIIYTDIRG